MYIENRQLAKFTSSNNFVYISILCDTISFLVFQLELLLLSIHTHETQQKKYTKKLRFSIHWLNTVFSSPGTKLKKLKVFLVDFCGFALFLYNHVCGWDVLHMNQDEKFLNVTHRNSKTCCSTSDFIRLFLLLLVWIKIAWIVRVKIFAKKLDTKFTVLIWSVISVNNRFMDALLIMTWKCFRFLVINYCLNR